MSKQSDLNIAQEAFNSRDFSYRVPSTLKEDLETALEKGLKALFSDLGISTFEVKASLPNGVYFVLSNPVEKIFDRLLDQMDYDDVFDQTIDSMYALDPTLTTSTDTVGQNNVDNDMGDN